MKISHVSLAVTLLATGALGRDVPNNVRSLYDRVQSGKCTGGTVLQDGFYSKAGGSKTFAYCSNNADNVLYIHGNNNLFTNMDIDCDGDQSDQGDGRCGNSDDTQSETAFKDTVQDYSKIAGNEVSDLNANFIPYVVFGNEGTKSGYTTFDPTNYSVQPLSVMAVVCGDKMIYGVWGDTNGDDGPPMVGEASISLATACNGTTITGDNGHDQDDVMYIAFPGSVSDTVHKHADWAAKDFDAFESCISATGDELIERLS